MASLFLLKLAVACSLLFSEQNTAYQIPSLELKNLEEQSFHVSIPDEVGVQLVFYMLQVDGKCPAAMDYITEAVNGSWTSRQRFGLQNNDKLRVSVLVQYNDHVYEKTETRVILNSRLVTTQQSSSRDIGEHTNDDTCDAYIAPGKPVDCKPTISIVGGSSAETSCQGELLFEDNFSGTELNRSVWTHDIRQRLYHEDEELVAFDDSPQTSFVREGYLHIAPMVASDVTGGAYQLGERCTAIKDEQECRITKGSYFKINPPVYSAQMHSRNAFSFKYGKIVVRAKLPKGDWLFPYMMLQPVSTHAESHYANQLRIAFARGNFYLRNIKQEDISGHRLYGGMIIWHEGQPIQVLKNKLNTKHFGDGFHNYTMIWKRDKLTLKVDDETYGEIDKGLPFFDEKCFIIFGVTVGGFLNFDDNILPSDVKPYKNKNPRAALAFWQSRDNWAPTWSKTSAMIIDFVRVYAD